MIRKTLAALMVASMGIIGIVSALNPLDDDDWDTDPDKDGLNNREEFVSRTDPNNWDSDADGLPDGWEIDNSMNPTDPSDGEEDNDYFMGEEYAEYSQVDSPYTNYDEYYRFYLVDPRTGENLYFPTNPNDEDTDGDGILDPDDPWPGDHHHYPCFCCPPGCCYCCCGCHCPRHTESPPDADRSPPKDYPQKDSDGDGLKDWDEAFIGTDPFNPDTDGDGLSDPQELSRHLDPNDWDSDNDMLIDGVEEGSGTSTDGHVDDTNNDGLGA